jgi:hypothetical protein
MLGDDVYDPDDGGDGGSSGNKGTGGSKPSAGKPSKGGKATGGAVTTGGAGPIPVAGAATGGFPTGGSPSFGGAFPSFGGSFPSFGGAFPTGGFGGGVPIDCQTCLFQTCSGELSKCLQDIGCVSILACSATTGCQGFDCYTPEACAGVIDQFGGPKGESMSRVLGSLSCVLTSGCPCLN